MKLDFKGKTVLVTGGTKGIGKEIVTKFADSGANVLFTYKNSEDIANQLSKLQRGNNFIKGFRVDFSELSNIDRFIREINALYEINYLVNNAGILSDAPIHLIKNEDWDKVIQVNLNAVFQITKGFLHPLIRTKGSIVNISSISGIIGNKGQINYSASKAAIIGLSKSLAKEMGGLGVRVNTIAPGYIETEMTQESNVIQRIIRNNVALKRIGYPDEIANIVLFLLSNLSSYITGQVIVADGGLL